jgi:hypothetical protein
MPAKHNPQVVMQVAVLLLQLALLDQQHPQALLKLSL